jgi:precorrin-8X/cobalt-precorrin-8 methylmutase
MGSPFVSGRPSRLELLVARCEDRLMPGLFDRYVLVDWSGAAKPSRGKDSIWSASGDSIEVSSPQNPATRAEATELLRNLLVAAAGRGERVLIGFDFPYGFPAGFAAALQLSSLLPPWRETWARLMETMHDASNNANRRFDDARALNEAIGSPPGPFWGHPPGFIDSALTWKVKFPFSTPHGPPLGELRHTERHLRSLKRLPFPVWKLAGQGAVGSQALLGIPRVASLRFDDGLAAFSRVWPFETGFTADPIPDSGPFILHAEIWPGVLAPDLDSHPIADARHVLALVRWAQQLDTEGQLAAEFALPRSLDEDQVTECVGEEGWTLGATNLAPRAEVSTGTGASRASDREAQASTPAADARHHIAALFRAGVISEDERDELIGRV